eukprot:m.292240 g.292240  ORF g.292240 m.292240 type:complete len:79 (-) comp55111_c1_seq3:594-830(-)
MLGFGGSCLADPHLRRILLILRLLHFLEVMMKRRYNWSLLDITYMKILDSSKGQYDPFDDHAAFSFVCHPFRSSSSSS